MGFFEFRFIKIIYLKNKLDNNHFIFDLPYYAEYPKLRKIRKIYLKKRIVSNL